MTIGDIRRFAKKQTTFAARVAAVVSTVKLDALFYAVVSTRERAAVSEFSFPLGNSADLRRLNKYLQRIIAVFRSKP